MSNPTTQVFKFRFGSTVNASDGEAGSLISVVIQPGQRRVTHVGLKLPGGTRVAAPLERVEDATAEVVRLSLTREALLQTMPAISGEATVFSAATRVSVGGRTGSMTQVTITRPANTFRRIGFRQGMGGESLADANGITDIADDGAVLLIIHDAAALRTYRADQDVLDDAQAALFNYSRLRIDLRAIQLRVIDGEIWLAGHVSTKLNQRIVAELLEGVHGAVAIHNAIVADPDLALAVAKALADDPQTHGQMIGVYPTLGKVFLRGIALTPDVAAAATRIATTVSGQGEVVNQLAVTNQTLYLPTMAPVTGTEDVIPGGD